MSAYAKSGADWNFTVEPAFETIPTGTITYEISTDLPTDYDQIYALDAAIKLATQRKRWAVRQSLMTDYAMIGRELRRYVESNVADRMERSVGLAETSCWPDPYEEAAWV